MKKTPVSPYLTSDALLALFHESHEAVYVLALDGGFIEANQTLFDYVGYTREELLETGFAPTVADENGEFVREQFRRARDGETTRYVATVRRRDGSEFRAQVINAPLFENGQPAAVLGIARELESEEKAAQARELEQMLEATLNSISDGLFLVDSEWRFTYVNPPGEQIAQRTKEELLGKNLWDTFPLMVGSELGIGYRRAMTERVKVVTRERYEPYDVIVETTTYPTRDGIAIYASDVTAEEAARQELAERDRRIASQAALLDSARDAIVMRGLDNRIQYWNKAATDLYGWSADEVTGKSILDFIYRTPVEFDKALAVTIANGEWAGDIEQTARDGRTIIADCRWSLVRDPDGVPEAILAVNTDVTARRQQEELTLRTQRMESLGTLAGGIAHDLNNVLTPLLMSAQLLAADENDEHKLASLAIIESSAKRGAEMIRQVLSFARGVEGRRIHVDTARLVRDTEAFCTDALPKSIKVSTQVPDDVWGCVGDPTQLLQVLVNLVANARDAMPDGGTLRISADNVDVEAPFTLHLATSGRYLHIRIEDTGTGIPGDLVAKVFEPFFTTKGVGEGTGLGLATSLTIVRSHGGNMQVHSELGAGSRFDIYLPAAIQTAAGDVPVRVAAPRGNGEMVLVVDDEPEIRRTVREALESYGYQTAVAANGADALEYLAAFPGTASLVFTDVTMPNMDGSTLESTIAELYPGLPVLLASGFASGGDPDGRRDFIAKPYSATDLRAAVARALGR